MDHLQKGVVCLLFSSGASHQLRGAAARSRDADDAGGEGGGGGGQGWPLCVDVFASGSLEETQRVEGVGLFIHPLIHPSIRFLHLPPPALRLHAAAWIYLMGGWRFCQWVA